MRRLLSAAAVAAVGALCCGLLQTATAQAPASCSSFVEFAGLMDPLNAACCVGDSCTAGAPTSCPGNCAAVLLPVQAACAHFLSSMATMAAVKSMIDGAAAQCGSSGCACQNGGVCATPGGHGGGGHSGGHHRSLQAGASTCECPSGFTGDLCETSVRAPKHHTGCDLTLPYLTTTLEGLLDPGKWKVVAGDFASFALQISQIDWTLTADLPTCPTPVEHCFDQYSADLCESFSAAVMGADLPGCRFDAYDPSHPEYGGSCMPNGDPESDEGFCALPEVMQSTEIIRTEDSRNLQLGAHSESQMAQMIADALPAEAAGYTPETVLDIACVRPGGAHQPSSAARAMSNWPSSMLKPAEAC